MELMSIEDEDRLFFSLCVAFCQKKSGSKTRKFEFRQRVEMSSFFQRIKCSAEVECNAGLNTNVQRH